MGAVRDRDGEFSDGREQSFPVDGTRRIYRHTLTGLGADGTLRPLSDALGLRYVGVSAAAIHPQALPGRGTRPGDRRGVPLAPVRQWGELSLGFRGTASDLDLGEVCYCVDDETVTTDPSELTARHAVGRLVRRNLIGTDLVRVLISGFPCCCGGRQKLSLEPHTYSDVVAGANYRIGVALPYEWEDVTYAAKLLCHRAEVVCNEDSGPKSEGKAYWNVFVPTVLGPYPVDLTFTPWLAGEGWTGPLVGPHDGTWDELVELS